ncbi:sigma 54-interacting response regulator [Paraflavitalea sp. CAU 1676]|uniref:sigma 54-interacting response regulator n=1 Tax=Paraflavitalea sp. CAU 1676 TaxID=3032598 RepID=UPI0023DA0DDB|nr:sigma 54-interacting response regulator [Paraflavitalea sp. CAU 1676]MDF2187329.1 sigma 54-interacting response regulator [Paraflavitalea sp. CAU 1676]
MTEQILIVEDEFIVANDLKLILEKAGYKVCGIAASVVEARELIQQHKPGFVLLDIHLKGKTTGIQLAYELREQHIAFIYISANSNQQVLEAARATEPYGFLVKPFRARDVLISLDIARYRHKHSLEAGLRQEAILHEKLQTIATQSGGVMEKLLQAIRILQPYLPADLMLVSKTDVQDDRVQLSGYLRIGFDEYQWLGSDELITITGLSQSEWAGIQPNANKHFVPAWRNEEAFNTVCCEDPVTNLLAETFGQHSLLQFPLEVDEIHSSIITMYSRKPDAWHAGHLALLQRMKAELATIIDDGKASPNRYAANGIPKTNPVTPAVAKNKAGFEGIVGNSHQLLRVLDQVSQVAPLDTSVLILGESGTGKERIAHCIHLQSSRSAMPFVKINCAALPPTLIESELFGHEKGAFTGALDRRIGKFEQANGGTIFLDEIGEMPLELQVKLLRVLQEKEIERIGGQAPFKINVRIVAATNRNLEQEVAEGRFRLDLYYRLNVFPVILPALRERREDIKYLAHHFALLASRRNNRHFQGITPAMMTELEAWHWPGNIRELENVMEQTVILNAEGRPLALKRPLNTGILPGAGQGLNAAPFTQAQSLTDIKKIQDETEREYIISMLRKANGRIRGEGGAAQLLNLKPTTLESRMLKLGIRKENL